MKRFTHHRVRLPHNSRLGDQSHLLPSPGVSLHLPAELLVSVFIHVANDSYIRMHYGCSSPTVPSWVNVSYVCRYWRDVALNCPTLWSYIPTMPQRWTQELLARSQMAPLKVYTRLCDLHFDPSQEQMTRIVEQVMNHSQRIQKLRLDVGMISHATGYPILSRFLFTHLPCLQDLEISDFLPQPEEKSWSLFEEKTPALRTLRSTCCSIRWYALGPSVLTTLHLSSARIVIHENTMADFLAVLRCMPHLVQLSVEDSLPSARDFLSNGELDATPMISLSRLSNMSIRMAPLSAAIALLSCVDIPFRTKVRLEVLPEYTSEDIHISTLDDYVRLASLLGQRISQSDSPNFRSLIMGNPWEFALAFSTSERVECYPPGSFSSIGSDDILLKVDFVGDLPMRCHEPDLSRIYSSIPLTGIQSVHFLRFGPPVSLEFWRITLASLPNVQHIRFSLYAMPNITSMFSLPFHHLARNRQNGCADRGQGEIFVPALEELELYRTTLERVCGRRDPNPSVADVQALYDAISTRQETRCRLTIKECRLMTDGGVVKDLESVGWWEGDQFRVTSNVRYTCGCWRVARQACSLLWSGVLLLRSIFLVCLCGLWRKIIS